MDIPFTYSILFSEIVQHKVPHKYYSNKKVCIIEMVCIIVSYLYMYVSVYISKTWPGKTLHNISASNIRTFTERITKKEM